MKLHKMWSRYLMWFAHEHVDFRHAELQSILTLFNIEIKFIEKPDVDKPYWIVELPNEESAKKICSRSVALKSCIELWSRAKTGTQLHQNLHSALVNKSNQWISNGNGLTETHVCPSALIEACCSAEKSFKLEVETFCKHFSLKEKVAKIEKFSYLPMEGPVKMKNPDVTLSYMEFYGLDPNNIPDEPLDLFFGRWAITMLSSSSTSSANISPLLDIGLSQITPQHSVLGHPIYAVADGQRDLIQVHSLKKRHFIGNTSMDAQLSLLTVNQARVRCGDVVLDPFVGSGSLLVAAAHFGGYVWGSDIDFMMVHGRTRPTRVGLKVREKEESIRSNMRQYKTQSRYLDVLVSDFSLPLWRGDLKFDAIITDPPYGVREPTEKIGIQRDNYSLAEHYLPNHIPSKVEYGLPQLYADLLGFAARHLNEGGRLVCWYPIIREDYRPSQLPAHPRLRLIANSEQVLTKLTARRLLTYELTRDTAPLTLDTSTGTNNFREKYFSTDEPSRRERREKKAEDIAANRTGNNLRIGRDSKNNDT